MKIAYNPTPAELLTGTIEAAVIQRQGMWIACTKTWEGPARPEYVAALADLKDKLGR